MILDENNIFSQSPTDNECLNMLMKLRYPQGIFCRKCCKITKHYKLSKRKMFECEFCGNQVSPMANTIFHKSPTPLNIWFKIIYRIVSTHCDISAKQIQREFGLTYKTAWRMANNISNILNYNGNDADLIRKIANLKDT